VRQVEQLPRISGFYISVKLDLSC